MKKKLQNGSAIRVPIIAGFGGAALLMLLTLPTAKLLETGSISAGAVKIVGYVLLAIASLATGIYTSWRVRSKTLPCCLLSSGILFTVLVVMNALINHGKFYTIGQTAGIVFGLGIVAALLFTGRKRKYG